MGEYKGFDECRMQYIYIYKGGNIVVRGCYCECGVKGTVHNDVGKVRAFGRMATLDN